MEFLTGFAEIFNSKELGAMTACCLIVYGGAFFAWWVIRRMGNAK